MPGHPPLWLEPSARCSLLQSAGCSREVTSAVEADPAAPVRAAPVRAAGSAAEAAVLAEAEPQGDGSRPLPDSF